MSRRRFSDLTVLVLALSVLAARNGQSAEPARGEQSCAIYSLSDLGDDPELGKWIAETIPQVIEPGSWKQTGEQGALHYYGPKKVLVIYQTPAVQAKVDAFLKDLKKSLAAAPERSAIITHRTESKQGVTPAEYREPASIPAANAVPEPGLSYPVPAPVRPPKHLFHFIIRYEGDGLVDENVVKAIKAQAGDKQDAATAVVVPTAPAGWSPPEPLAKPMRNAEDKEKESSPPSAVDAKTTKKDDPN